MLLTALDVKITVEPAQKVVAPLAVIVGTGGVPGSTKFVVMVFELHPEGDIKSILYEPAPKPLTK